MHIRLAVIESQSANLTVTRTNLASTIQSYCSTTSHRLTALHDDLAHLEFAVNTELGLPAALPPVPRPSSPVPTPKAIAAHIDGIDLRQTRRELIIERWRDIDISDIQEELELDNATFGRFLTPATLDRIDQCLARLEMKISTAVSNARSHEDPIHTHRPRCTSLPSSLHASFVPLRALYH